MLHIARLLASQMTSAGVGVGAKAKGIRPQQDSPGPRESSSPVVRDPRKRRREGEEEGEGRKRKRIKEEPEEEETVCVACVSYSLDTILSPQPLERSMAELSYLGKLLGLPHVLDPTFHQAYNAMFGGPQVGEGAIKMETNPQFVQGSNVRCGGVV